MSITFNKDTKNFDISWKKTDHKTDHRTDYKTDNVFHRSQRRCGGWGPFRRCRTHRWTDPDTNLNRRNAELNENNRQLNEDARTLNEKNTKTNDGYRTTQTIASVTRGSDYVPQRQNLRTHDSDDASKAEYERAFREFYLDQKLQRWNTDLGAKPLYGEFDADYYA